MQKFLLFMFAILLSSPPDLAFAQRGRVGTYYQPRVYNSPPPRYSRDAYIAGGAIVGGGVGYGAGLLAAPFTGPAVAGAAPIVTGPVGGYYGGRLYDNQSQYMQQRYYYPPAYGVQTTTPYMLRTVPRY